MSLTPALILACLATRGTCLKAPTLATPADSLEVPTTMALYGGKWFLKPVNDNATRAEHPTGYTSTWQSSGDCSIPPRHGKLHSQADEDMDLYNAFFCNKTNGQFVEMGALDGVHFSNTKFFEDELGWSGALIEASPTSAEKLAVNRKNPKNSIFAEGVCPEGQHRMDFLVDGNPAIHGNPATMGKHYMAHYHNGSTTKISVPCRTLSQMLGAYMRRTKATHIDFFSLDVEGGELAVLQTFKFDVKVNVWLIEMDSHNLTKNEEVRKLLRKHGYAKSKTGHFDHRNEVWVIPEMDRPHQHHP